MSMLQHLDKVTSKPKKRLGRGVGSGKGEHTVGRGTKGQRARKSGNAPAWFEGGQLPLTKRLPMNRGKSRFNVIRPSAMVTLNDIEAMKSDTITLETLKIEKVIDSKFKKAKIVSNGALTRKVTVSGGVRVSKTAATIIEQAGGTVEVPSA